MEADFAQALDIWNLTLQHLMTDRPALANFAYNKYQFFNLFFKNAVKVKGGDHLEGYITLESEGNAGHVGVWDTDTLVKKNIDRKYTMNWRQAKGGMLWNLMETSLNSGEEKIADVLEIQYESAIKDIIDEIYLAILTGPTSANDRTSPYSVFSWLPFGTASSTGGWTGYSGHYNDGGGASAATFNKGGIASSSTENTNWATYYADHAGLIDETLLEYVDRAIRKLNFQAPMIPKTVGEMNGNIDFSLTTNDNVISKLNRFYAMSDDNMGYNRDSHWGVPTIKSIPLAYADILDTARTSVYGTDPVIGLNHDSIKPVIHRDWNFKEIDGKDPNRAVVLQKLIYLRYQIWCKNPKFAGFLISQHPSS
jgi:hypothetical protein